MKKSELKTIIKECIREEMGTIKEGGPADVKQAMDAAKAFAKIEGNSKAMAALKNMNKDPQAFDEIIKKILSPQEYKAVKLLWGK